MKLSEQEKAAHKAAFRSMRPAEKLEYIYTYYKWPDCPAAADKKRTGYLSGLRQRRGRGGSGRSPDSELSPFGRQ